MPSTDFLLGVFVGIVITVLCIVVWATLHDTDDGT